MSLLERPPLVERAQALARAVAFEDSCSDETGRLLHVLAGTRGRFRAAEIGTGAGVGAAWIISALDPAVPREAPFDLVCVDAADLDGEEVLGVLAPRGLVLSGLQRGFWLGHPDLEAAEVSVSAREAVILAVRSR